MTRDEFMDLVGADYVDEYEKAQLSQEDATIVAKSKRTFVELLVHYPHPDACTYPEYKGKPYYSIKYIEDGECFVGFGTYKPEVLSQYLRDYFMSFAQPEERTKKRTESHGVCLDTISRQAAIRWVKTECNPYGKPTLDFESGKRVIKHLEQMPPAQPERKKGKWVKIPGMNEYCSACNQFFPLSYFQGRPFEINYCPNCGADMREAKVKCGDEDTLQGGLMSAT